MPHICEAGEVHTELLVDPGGKKQLGRPSINGRIKRLILTWISRSGMEEACTGLIWLRIGT